MDAQITQILIEASGGDDGARNELASITLDELRRIAAIHMQRERPDHTLTPTILAGEAFMNLVGPDGASIPWQSRAHFLAVAATEIRRILVDHARRRRAVKRGGEADHFSIHPEDLVIRERQVDLLALHEALEQLASFEPLGARVVEFRFFGGMTMQEIAEVEGIPLRTIEREWAAARAWLRRRLDE